MRHLKLRGGADHPSCTLRSFRRAEHFFTLIGYDYMPKLTLTALLTKCLLLQSAVHTKINNVTVIVFHTSISDISFAIISYTFFPSNFFALNDFFSHIKRFEAVTVGEDPHNVYRLLMAVKTFFTSVCKFQVPVWSNGGKNQNPKISLGLSVKPPTSLDQTKPPCRFPRLQNVQK